MVEKINLTEAILMDAINMALERSCDDLRQNHIWVNRTGNMEKSIQAQIMDVENAEIKIDVPYAEAVDYWKPFLDEFIENIEWELIKNEQEKINES